MDEPHHSKDDVLRYAEDAVSICDELMIRDSDRAVILPELVKLLAARHIIFAQPSAIPVGSIPGL